LVLKEQITLSNITLYISKLCDILMPQTTICDRGIMLSGCLFDSPSVCYPSFNTYFAWLDSGRISMKLNINVHHVSGNCWKGFQSRISNVKVKSRAQTCECYNGDVITASRLTCL